MLEKTTRDGVIYLKGLIHERDALIKLITEKPPLCINMEEVSAINSQGVLGFAEFMRPLSKEDVILVDCSTAVVDAICLVPAMLGDPPDLWRLRSFFVAYGCGDCNEEFEVLVNILHAPKVPQELSAQPCPKCSKETYPVNEPESIFMYLYPEKS